MHIIKNDQDFIRHILTFDSEDPSTFSPHTLPFVGRDVCQCAVSDPMAGGQGTQADAARSGPQTGVGSTQVRLSGRDLDRRGSSLAR